MIRAPRRNALRVHLEPGERQPPPWAQDAVSLAEHLGFVEGELDGIDAQCRVGGAMAKASARKCALLMEGTVRQADLLGALASSRQACG